MKRGVSPVANKVLFVPPELKESYARQDRGVVPNNVPVAHVEPPSTNQGPTIDVSNLPSGMLPYPKGARVSYRPYLFGEVLQYSQTPKGSSVSRFETILSGVTTVGFDVWDLTLGDVLFIGLMRRMSTFGAHQTWTVPVACKSCKAVVSHVVESGSLDFKDLTDSVPELPVVVSLHSGVVLQLGPLRMGRMMELIRKDQVDRAHMFAAQVLNLPQDEAYDILYNVSHPLDTETLEEVDRLLDHGLKRIQFPCPKCGKIISYNLEAFEELIRPFCPAGSAPKLPIRFGV